MPNTATDGARMQGDSRIAQLHGRDGPSRKATPEVARVRECPPGPNVYPSRTREAEGMPPQATRQPHLQGFCLKPSDGLEPSTPSLPFRFWDGKRGHTRAFAATKIPQTDGIRQRDVTRVWTRVVGLMFPPCSLACGPRPDRSVPVATAYYRSSQSRCRRPVTMMAVDGRRVTERELGSGDSTLAQASTGLWFPTIPQ